MRTILDVAREVRPQVVHIQYHNEDYDAVEMISALPLCLKETLPETLAWLTAMPTASVATVTVTLLVALAAGADCVRPSPSFRPSPDI